MAEVIQIRPDSFKTPPATSSDWYAFAMERLVEVIQKLSQARSIETITDIVRVAARNLTRADGATFVLREGDQCYYAEENAIAPLWKGRRFPLNECVSGWVMLNGEPAMIEDVYTDSRVPTEVYKPTFVKSMLIVPIRRAAPIGAIGNYWAVRHRPSNQELKVLQALADTTSVAIENAQLFTELEMHVRLLQQQQTQRAS